MSSDARDPRWQSVQPPHAATVAQPKVPHPATVQGNGRAPHPATVAQPKVPHPATAQGGMRPPHPATVAQPRSGLLSAAPPPHAATLERRDVPHPVELQQRAGSRTAQPMDIEPVRRRSSRFQEAGYTHDLIPMIGGHMIASVTRDKHGVDYWNGYRTTLHWNSGTKSEMAKRKAGGCAVKAKGCVKVAESIDHIIDFATTQSALPVRTYCDGSYHWTGVLYADAEADYNNTKNLQWSCTPCNSSKSGARGLYSPPKLAGLCPGATCAL